MKFAGAHVSIAGGVENAPLNAAAIGATAFAMFTKNQRQWNAPPISEASAAAFKENCRKHGYTPDLILPHDGYLINMGNPDPEKRKNYDQFGSDFFQHGTAGGGQVTGKLIPVHHRKAAGNQICADG